MSEDAAAEMVPLARIATVLRVPAIRSEPLKEGEILRVVTPRDLPVRGFVRSASEQVLVRVKDEEIEPYLLRPWDLLFLLTAPIGRMAIMPEGLAGDWVCGPQFAIVRFPEEPRDQAVALFAFFRQGEGRQIVAKLQADGRVRLLPLEAFARIRVPRLTDALREWSQKVLEREPAAPPDEERRPERPGGRGGPGGRGDRDRRPGDRRDGDRQGGERSARGGRPGGGRPGGGRPGGGRPGGDRPRGSRPPPGGPRRDRPPGGASSGGRRGP